MSTLTLLRGVSGAGKTTLANTLVTSLPNAFAIAADDFFETAEGYKWDASRLRQAHQWCQEVVNYKMQAGRENIIVHNTSTTEKELKPYLEMAEYHGYSIVSLVVENRHGNASVHDVPKATVNSQKAKLRQSLKL